MKKIVILLSFIGISFVSASTPTTKEVNTNRIINILIKHDLLVKREVPQSREVRKSREARKSRISRMGRDSRGLRQERFVRTVYKIPNKNKTSTSATKLIKKSYLSKLSK